MEGLINWFSKNHVAANFSMLIVVILGCVTWFKLKKEIFPETAMDIVMVSVPFPGGTPEEVERGVCVPIEEAVQDLDGIKRLKSTASPNMGAVTVEVQTGYDVRDMMDELKTRIDAVQNFAEDAEEPILEELKIKAQVLSVAVSADTDERTLLKLTEQVRDALLNTGVTQASIAGARDYEISIEVSEDALQRYGITFDQVTAAVRASSIDLPGGSVKTSGGEILIRTEQRRYTANEFEAITVVTREDGSVVRLRDLGEVNDGFEEEDLWARFDGRSAMLINVYRVGNEDTMAVAKAVKDYIRDDAPKYLPKEVRLEVWRDDSVMLGARMMLLARNGATGLLLVFIVLALFLRPSLAAFVAIGIPVSFAGAIWMIPYTGISINMISLFAFILVLGIVVDDAIVVGENVYSRIRGGEHPKLAAPRGTHEVGVVVIFGVLTTAVAFTPMLGLSGVSGKIWPNIPLIVIPTLMFSLVQSKLILPCHLSFLKPYDENAKVGPIMRFQRMFSRGLESFVDRVYRPALRVCLTWRWAVLFGFIAIFIVTCGLMATGWIKFKFFPEVEVDILTAKLEMPPGAPFESTAAVIEKIERAATRLAEQEVGKDGNSVVKHMLSTAGTQPFASTQQGAQGSGSGVRSNVGEVTLELVASEDRDKTGAELRTVWRDLAGPIAGVASLSYQTVGAASGNAIDLVLTGSNLDSLERAAEDVKAALGGFEGVIDIASSNRLGNRELKLNILPQAEALGLRLEDVARQVRQGFYGDEVQRLQRGRDEVKVFVRYPEAERKSITQLNLMKIRTRGGAEVPFSSVATAAWGRSAASIQREGRSRSIVITADIDEGTGANANEVVAAITKEGVGDEPDGALVKVTKDYQGIRWGFQGEQEDQRSSVGEIGMRGFLALGMMYVLMAIALKSYLQPLIVMSVIPFGLVGAVAGHVAMGFSLSIMSMCGIVALAGVVVNDSLVLVEYVNRQRAIGKSMIDAAWEAGASRFRPILLTSLTTFAGLTPMLLETDVQARFLIPMAVSLAFGILFATVITLVLIPVLYLIQNDVFRVLRFLAGR